MYGNTIATDVMSLVIVIRHVQSMRLCMVTNVNGCRESCHYTARPTPTRHPTRSTHTHSRETLQPCCSRLLHTESCTGVPILWTLT